MNKQRLLELAGVTESVASEIGRKLTSRVSGKEHARRLGLLQLQHSVDIIKHILDEGVESNPERIEGLLKKIRKDMIETIKALKEIEK